MTQPPPNRTADRLFTLLVGISLLIFSLIIFVELYHHIVSRQQLFWDEQYIESVRSDEKSWNFGFRVEDVEQRIETEQFWIEQLEQIEYESSPSNFHLRPISNDNSVSSYIEKISNHLENLDNFVTLSCMTTSGFLSVGLSDFEEGWPDCCTIHTRIGSIGPHGIFEIVQLDRNAVGLRALSNQKFLKLVPPPTDNWSASWRLEVTSTIPGLAERFQINQASETEKLEKTIFSELMGGYLQCNTPITNNTKLFAYPGDEIPEYYLPFHFLVRSVPSEILRNSFVLRSLSNHIMSTQSRIFNTLAKSRGFDEKQSEEITKDNTTPIKIAIVVPMTSKGTQMYSVEGSPFWINLFASFLETVNWMTNSYYYTFFLGFDKGDEMYDLGDSWNDMRQIFNQYLQNTMQFPKYSKERIAEIKKMVRLELRHYGGRIGAPSQIVGDLANDAYHLGYDYFYQVNDDTYMVTQNWAEEFIKILQSNPIFPNIGVTGPIDTRNSRILTHSFVHRTHIDIFGRYFPFVFKNWWSDDWISNVYGESLTFRSSYIQIVHNVEAQKSGATQRYNVDQTDQLHLRDEILIGYVTLNKYLQEHGLPTKPLPVICDYIRLLNEIASDIL